MQVLFTSLWFLLLLTILVIIHELGHFLAAKFLGVHVLEFGLGYPPRVRKLFHWWGTEFTLNSLPLGGFVRLYGDDTEEEFPSEKPEVPGSITEKQAFRSQAPWKRLIIVAAGVAVNFIFGALVFAGLYSYFGIPESLGHVRVVQVVEGSPAQQAGLRENDEIFAMTVAGKETPVTAANQFSSLTSENSGRQIELDVKRGEETLHVSAKLRTLEERADGQGALGVVPDDQEIVFYPWWQQPFRGIWIGVRDSLMLSGIILQTLGDMVRKLFVSGEIPKDVSGPIGIVSQAYKAKILEQGWPASVRYLALLSINLAVMNLLPIPALDGGRGLFILLERILGKKRRVAWEQRANGIGIMFLGILIVLISLKDVIGIFR